MLASGKKLEADADFESGNTPVTREFGRLEYIDKYQHVTQNGLYNGQDLIPSCLELMKFA